MDMRNLGATSSLMPWVEASYLQDNTNKDDQALSQRSAMLHVSRVHVNDVANWPTLMAESYGAYAPHSGRGKNATAIAQVLSCFATCSSHRVTTA